MSGIPIYNVNNNCATGSSALHMCYNLIRGGIYSCGLALGFEKMERGSLGMKYPDRTNPLDKTVIRSEELNPNATSAPFAPKLFGAAGEEHIKLFGTDKTHFAKVAAKNHKHSLNNPYSQFQKGYTLEQILDSPKITPILTKLQCCPTSDGAGAAILCNEAKVKEWKLEDQAVEILDMELTTDTPKMYANNRELVGYNMAKDAADKGIFVAYTAFKKTGLKPEQIGVIELHDCFSANELLTYEALGLCKEGEAGKWIDAGKNTYGGQVVVNPSGGLISKGHPLGATGLAQCAELNWQLRGIADKRQVPNLTYALQHNLGLGGACVVAIYKKYRPGVSKGTSDPTVLEKLEKAEQPAAKL
jgi:sterol carrier protein 2